MARPGVMRWLALALALPGCALAQFSETPEGQPVFVLGNPSCVFICVANIGTARSESGATSLSQSGSATGGAALTGVVP